MLSACYSAETKTAIKKLKTKVVASMGFIAIQDKLWENLIV